MVTAVILLAAALAVQSAAFFLVVRRLLGQQQDLMDRLMARDFVTYRTMPPPVTLPVAPAEPEKKPFVHSVLGGVC